MLFRMLLSGRASRLVSLILLAAFLVLASASTSRAQLTFTLSPVNSNLAPGASTSLLGTLTLSATATESYNLLGASANVTGPNANGLTIDDNDFLQNLPFVLAPGESYSSGIGVSAGVSAPPGFYTFTYQVDAEGVNTATPASGVGTSLITVTAVSTNAPEPGSLALFGVGIVPLVAGMVRRRRAL